MSLDINFDLEISNLQTELTTNYSNFEIFFYKNIVNAPLKNSSVIVVSEECSSEFKIYSWILANKNKWSFSSQYDKVLNKIFETHIIIKDNCIEIKYFKLKFKHKLNGQFFFTSGTTGSKKIIYMPFKYEIENAKRLLSTFSGNYLKNAVHVSSLNHTGGWNIIMIACLISQKKISISIPFNPFNFLKVIKNESKNIVTHLTPGQVFIINKINKTPSSLKIKKIFTGSTFVGRVTIQRLHKISRSITTIYGLTECGPFLFYNTVNKINDLGQSGMKRFGYIGKSGEMILKNSQLGSIVNRDGVVEKIRTYKTGDFFYKEKNNKYFYIGRAKEFLKFKNIVLSPYLVEDELSRPEDEFEIEIRFSIIKEEIYLMLYCTNLTKINSKMIENRHARSKYFWLKMKTHSIVKIKRTESGKVIRPQYDEIFLNKALFHLTNAGKM